MTALAYVGAALAEIAGCFAFWAWLRLDKAALWLVPGVFYLCVFAYLLTLVDAEHAGRTFAAYGGVYIAASILWLWLIERVQPDRWDLIGAAVCRGGAAIILFGPRPSLAAAKVRFLPSADTGNATALELSEHSCAAAPTHYRRLKVLFPFLTGRDNASDKFRQTACDLEVCLPRWTLTNPQRRVLFFFNRWHR